jgi:hypothetical protein
MTKGRDDDEDSDVPDDEKRLGGGPPLLIHEMGEYNLYLLRNIFEAFDEKGEIVVGNFREHRY